MALGGFALVQNGPWPIQLVVVISKATISSFFISR